MAFLERKKSSIYYEIIGTSGPWLTLINGHTRSSRDFRLLAGKLSLRGLRCLLFDNRGSGETIANQPFSLTDIADDVIALYNSLHIQQSVVLGLSMGGLISQILAEKYSERVLGLILVSTGNSEQSLATEAYLPWGSTLESVENKLLTYFSKDFCRRNNLIVRAMSKQILEGIISEDFEARSRMQRQAMHGVDTRLALKSMQQKTLVLHGTEDQIIPFEAAEEIAALLPHAELKALPGIGHLVLAEYSRKLGDEIVDFYEKNGWMQLATQ